MASYSHWGMFGRDYEPSKDDDITIGWVSQDVISGRRWALEDAEWIEIEPGEPAVIYGP